MNKIEGFFVAVFAVLLLLALPVGLLAGGLYFLNNTLAQAKYAEAYPTKYDFLDDCKVRIHDKWYPCDAIRNVED